MKDKERQTEREIKEIKKTETKGRQKYIKPHLSRKNKEQRSVREMLLITERVQYICT